MSWFRRRRRNEFSTLFEEMEKLMDRMFRGMYRSDEIPEEPTFREKLPSRGEIRRWGPYVYGYSITIGPDGKPMIREFGNVRPRMEGPTLAEEREPVVDVIEEKDRDRVRVIAELPGVSRKDIKLNVTEREVSIRVDTPNRKYSRDIRLPCAVKPKAEKERYANGVLELVLEKSERGSRART